MNGGGKGVTLLSSEGGDACDTVLSIRGREHLWHFPMCCRFQGTLSTSWGIEGVLIYRNFSVPLSVPPHTPLHYWSSQVVAGRSLDHMRVFRYRTIRGTHGIQGGCSMMVAVGVDTPLGKSLWWPWRVRSILDWVWWLDGGTSGSFLQAKLNLQPDVGSEWSHFLLPLHWWPWWLDLCFPSVFWHVFPPDHCLRVLMHQGLIEVCTLRGFDWAIVQWLHFFYCCGLPRLGVTTVSNLLGLQTWLFEDIVPPIGSFFLRGRLFVGGML